MEIAQQSGLGCERLDRKWIERNEAHSKSMVTAPAVGRASRYLWEMISNWFEIMGNMIKKKKNEMLHDGTPSYAPFKILLVVVLGPVRNQSTEHPEFLYLTRDKIPRWGRDFPQSGGTSTPISDSGLIVIQSPKTDLNWYPAVMQRNLVPEHNPWNKSESSKLISHQQKNEREE